jgi:diaminohydroxyphosphoribosylaminopyrimidine deaminase/5-amino-6-(5-phosphoribosylamino)uracil reductase
MFVTLEPCGHHGKTPPCSGAIAEAGVRRVFYASHDPNPETRGKGPRFLRRQGIAVHAGLLERESFELNAPYFHWRDTGLPWVVLKWAMTADGKIAARTGDARWISGDRSRNYAHALRRRVDAVICGTETYRVDDPNLLPRPARGRFPLRVILDRRGCLPLKLQIFGSDDGPRLYVTSKHTSERRCRSVEKRGVEVWRVGEKNSGLDLRALLRRLGKRGVSQVLVEGGAAVHGSLVDAKLANEAVVFVAPKVLGGAAAPGPVGGRGPARVAQALTLLDPSVRRLGEDVVIEGCL